jgi:hypothetical protein
MKSLLFLSSLFVGTIALSGIVGEQPRLSASDDAKEAKQLREEKTAKFLTDLLGCLQKMLEMQTAVYDDSKELHKVIQDNPDKKPRPEDEQTAQKLASKEKDIVREAAKAFDMVEEEGFASFVDILRDVRKDLERLQDRLKNSDVGTETQALEAEIIDCFKDSIRALKSR